MNSKSLAALSTIALLLNSSAPTASAVSLTTESQLIQAPAEAAAKTTTTTPHFFVRPADTVAAATSDRLAGVPPDRPLRRASATQHLHEVLPPENPVMINNTAKDGGQDGFTLLPWAQEDVSKDEVRVSLVRGCVGITNRDQQVSVRLLYPPLSHHHPSPYSLGRGGFP